MMTRDQAEAAGWRVGRSHDTAAVGINGPLTVVAGLSDCQDRLLAAITAIERYAALEAENQRLRAALAPFAEYYNRREYLRGIHEDYYRVVDIKVKTLRAAAKAMEESE